MNDDDFENKLRALTRSLHRPDPTAAWKADILATARREANAAPASRRLPPRWLLATWAAAWIAIALLSITTPRLNDRGGATNVADSDPVKESGSRTMLNSSPKTLIALDYRLHLNNDMP